LTILKMSLFGRSCNFWAKFSFFSKIWPIFRFLVKILKMTFNLSDDFFNFWTKFSFFSKIWPIFGFLAQLSIILIFWLIFDFWSKFSKSYNFYHFHIILKLMNFGNVFLIITEIIMVVLIYQISKFGNSLIIRLQFITIHYTNWRN